MRRLIAISCLYGVIACGINVAEASLLLDDIRIVSTTVLDLFGTDLCGLAGGRIDLSASGPGGGVLGILDLVYCLGDRCRGFFCGAHHWRTKVGPAV